MAKPSSTTAAPPRITPKKTSFLGLVKKLRTSQAAVSGENKSQKEMIEGTEGAHAGVTRLIVKLDKMDPVARDEYLFQFDVVREFMDWAKSTPSLGLEDRPGGDDRKATDAEPDLRPRHLRQPGASATSVEALAEGAGAKLKVVTDPPRRSVADAADAAEANLNKVGRGPIKPVDPTKH